VGSDDKKEDKGFVVGGISFGFGPGAGQVSAGDPAPGEKTPPARKPQPGAPIELSDALLPLRVVAVVDLVPRGEFNAGAHPPEVPVAVDPAEFDTLFRRLQPKVALEIESVLHDGNRVRVDFAPTSLKSFRPDSLVDDIPLLRSLLEGRRVLESLRDGSTSVDGAASELSRLWKGSSLVSRVLGGVEIRESPAARAAAPPPAAASADVDALLDMVDLPGAAPSPAPAPAPKPAAPAPSADQGRFGAFIAAVAHSGKDKPGANPDAGIRLIDKAISAQLGAILQHPELRRLEQAWRGIHFLASRTPKSGVKLEVMCARAEEAPEALERAIAHGEGISPPVSVAVVDVEVDGDAATLARARRLAEIGEAHVVPVIVNATAQLMGHDRLDDIDRLDNKQALFEAKERVAWRSEANRPAMLWLTMACNRVYARGAYDKKSARVRGATVEELPNDADAATVWINPAWAVASLITQSFAKTGWPCRISGGREGGVIEDLQVREVAVSSYEGDERIAIPTEVFFSTETQRALGRLGLLALAAQPNADSCYVLSAATAYVPPPKRNYDYDTGEDPVRLPQASLNDQLFVARLAQFLQALGNKIGADNPPASIQKVLEAAVWELFGGGNAGMEVQVDVGDKGGKTTASVTVRPRRFLGVSLEEVTLGVPLA
jgi:type VI secretion system ImpC/EvpB family protein/type VI secretion system ImpB/VipA family protein